MSVTNGAHNRQHLLFWYSVLIIATLGFLYLGSRHYSTPILHRINTSAAEGGQARVCSPAAPYLSPAELLEGRTADVETTSRGIPKLIHQSWIDLDLPVKFEAWSNSWRIKHPDWQWVLWTDEDNAKLVARHPELEPTYYALKNGIQRADFARNLYMWEYGGVYTDLDSECLRSLDDLLDQPSESLSSLYPTIGDIESSTRLAYLGAMESVPGEWQEHSLPNAFMASVPRHSFWLFPIARILNIFQVKAFGDPPRHDASSDDAETVSGPVALKRALKTYHDFRVESEEVREAPGSGFTRVMQPMAQASLLGQHHEEVAVFEAGIIYPFSWITELSGAGGHAHCMATRRSVFNPQKCLRTTRAYERGAHAISYWSHSWDQNGDKKHLDVIGGA